MIVKVGRLLKEQLFSAMASNALFDYLEKRFQDEKDLIEVVFDFEDVEAVSTSFVGRFQERLNVVKLNHPVTRFRVVNMRVVIAKMFIQKE